jgi:hypothetical protein
MYVLSLSRSSSFHLPAQFKVSTEKENISKKVSKAIPVTGREGP